MARVIVVGAGIVGASIAYHSVGRGATVTLVEQGGPASGATGRSFGWIGTSGDWPGGAAKLRDGVLPEWRRWERELPAVQVKWTGSLSWASEGCTTGGSAAADGGVIGEVLGTADVAALEPNLRRPPVHALYARSDGAVDAAGVTAALVREAHDQGAHVLHDIEVQSLSSDGTHVVGVETSHGFLPADVVVLAAGTAVPRLAASVGARIPVDASPALLLRFAAPPGLVRTVVSSPDADLREAAHGQLLVTVSWAGERTQEELDATGRRTAATIGSLWRSGDGLTLTAASVGVRPVPVDRAPDIGPVPGVGGLYVAVMHSAVTLAPLVGQLVAREVVDGIEAARLVGCRVSRLTRVE